MSQPGPGRVSSSNGSCERRVEDNFIFCMADNNSEFAETQEMNADAVHGLCHLLVACVMGSRRPLPLGARRGWRGASVCLELGYSQEQPRLLSVLWGLQLQVWPLLGESWVQVCKLEGPSAPRLSTPCEGLPVYWGARTPGCCAGSRCGTPGRRLLVSPSCCLS